MFKWFKKAKKPVLQQYDCSMLRAIIEQEFNKEMEKRRCYPQISIEFEKHSANVETLRLLRRLIDLLPPVA